MQLTAQDLTVLRKPFAVKDHEFLRGFTYITESAITTRIEDVDPEWTFEIMHVTTRDTQCIVHARMTIKGVTRDGIGMQVIQSAGEAEKGAATDALKRCARLFGIGRYLLDLPSGINDEKALAKHMGLPANVQQMPTDAAKQALGTPSGQRVETDDPLPTTPTLQPANVVKVSVKPTGEGNRKELILTMEDSKIGFVRAYSRKLFIDAGWIDDSQWMANEVIDLTPPIPVMLKRDAKTGRYWELAEVVKPVNPFLEKAAS